MQKAHLVMFLDRKFVDRYGANWPRNAGHAVEFAATARKAIGPISKDDAFELEDENYHSALGILMDAGLSPAPGEPSGRKCTLCGKTV